MLKKIPQKMTSDLVKVLMDMGHGNEICLANGNFPAVDYGRRVVNLSVDSISLLLKDILDFMPLDMKSDYPVILMEPMEEGFERPEIWSDYKEIIKSSEEAKAFKEFKFIDRQEFYERAKKCFVIVSTCDKTLYSNIILSKGVIA